MLPNLAALFAAQTSTTPTAPAVVFRGDTTTYEELFSDVARLASELEGHGVGPGVLVALALRRTPAAIAMLLAVLRAGGAYLPLDPRDPPIRTAFILSNSRAAVLVSDSVTSSFGDFRGTILELDKGRLVQRRYGGPPDPTVPASAAYVIYTSGSSGSPKGVILGHGATHLVDWARKAYSEAERARVAATTSLCFDPSIFEIFVPLGTGGAMILKDNGLEAFRPDERPTMLDSVPSVLTELCRSNALPESLLVLNVGGETLSAALAQEVYARSPRLALYNHYGPTEATTCVTVGRVPHNLAGEPSIGRAVRGAQVMVLAADGQPTENEVGEIHIGGPGLALGYLNRPELNAERFVMGPWGRQYRTGDLGYWRNGDLHFAGRLDDQVKVRGFRVELGEIEAALVRIPGVERALVTTRPGSTRVELLAYLQAAGPLTAAQVRRTLAASLPDHMLPSDTVILPKLPVLASGKVDRSALPEPQLTTRAVDARISRTERAIIFVFEEILGRGGLGPEDDFFECGGDSLSSVRAALRLEEVLGFEVAAAIIHQARTARALGEALQQMRLEPETHIAILNEGDARAPLFCMGDLYGQAFNYLGLVRHLGRDRPVYGLVPGRLREAFTRDGDIARLTEAFKLEVRRIRPNGPYLIAGYSAAGVLAVDLACALEREGETVKLVLIDACLHAKGLPFGLGARWAMQQIATLADPAGPYVALRRLKSLARDFVERLTPGAPNWIPRAQSAYAASMINAAAHYCPREFRGETLMVLASERHPLDLLFDQDGILGWSGAMKGEVSRATVSGGHHAIMREPLVAVTARSVVPFLEQAAQTSAA